MEKASSYITEAEISTDKSRLDFPLIHKALNRTYWAAGIPEATLKTAIENSLCFGVYLNQLQVGFARLVTDYSTFAYLCDVFILEEFRGQGLSKLLMQHIKSHPQLQGLRRWLLVTRDAHSLYSRFGFTELQLPERYMELHKPNPYQNLVS